MSYAAEVLADGPVWWARLAETAGTRAADAMGGAAGTYSGGHTLARPSLLNSDATSASVELDGTSGQVTFPDSAALDIGNTGTIECWVVFDAFRDRGGGAATLLDKGAGHFILRQTNAMDGTLLLRRNGVADICTSTIRCQLGVLYHVVATLDGKLYVNGIDVTLPRNRSVMANNAFSLGVGVGDVGNGPNGWFDGRIAEPAIYRTNLSAARVLAHYRAGITLNGTGALNTGAGVAAAGTKRSGGIGSIAVAGAVATGSRRQAAGACVVPVANVGSAVAGKQAASIAECGVLLGASPIADRLAFGGATIGMGAATTATAAKRSSGTASFVSWQALAALGAKLTTGSASLASATVAMVAEAKLAAGRSYLDLALLTNVSTVRYRSGTASAVLNAKVIAAGHKHARVGVAGYAATTTPRASTRKSAVGSARAAAIASTTTAAVKYVRATADLTLHLALVPAGGVPAVYRPGRAGSASGARHGRVQSARGGHVA